MVTKELVAPADGQPAGGLDAEFTNEQLGRIQITKKVTLNGQGTDTTKVDGEYKFTITKKNDADFTPIQTSIEVIGGVANSVTIGDLPIGEYVITENLEAGQTSLGIALASSPNVDVVASAETSLPPTANAEFTNNRNIGDLKVTKKVEGTDAADVDFPFTIELTPPEGVKFEDASTYPAKKTTSAGESEVEPAAASEAALKYELSLKTGETFEIKDLPT